MPAWYVLCFGRCNVRDFDSLGVRVTCKGCDCVAVLSFEPP